MTTHAEALRLYRKFLASIPLDYYREELKDVKWVEQDLYPEIVDLLLRAIYRDYWEKRNFIDFETWFEQLWKELHAAAALRRFTKYYFNKEDTEEDEWFKLGFKARMYRTWISMLTQMDFCYAFAYACEKLGKKVGLITNAELDRRGVDLRVAQIDFQVTKISERKEARPGRQKRGKRINIPYPVFNLKEYERKSTSPYVSPENRRRYKNILNTFHKYFLILKNSFVVFGEEFVDKIVENLESLEKLNDFIDEVLLSLYGKKSYGKSWL